MANVALKRLKPVSAFRKIAIGTWQTAYDPSIYGTMRIRMDRAVAFIKAFRERTGKKLTVTHLVTKAIAEALHETPEANAILRKNKIYLRQSIDISVLVVMEEKGQADLSATKIDGVDQKSLEELVDVLEEHAARIRAKKDKQLESTRQSMGLIPFLFINGFLKLLSFLMYGLNLNLSWLGLPRDPFGGAAVTSIGSLGLDIGYVPLVPYSRVPIWVAPGAVTDEPVVDEGQVTVGKVMNLNATFDHRIIDGAHAAKLAKTVRKVLEDPASYFGSEA